MSNKERDPIIWETIISFYKEIKTKNKRQWTFEQLEKARETNQKEAYWCKDDKGNQELFINKPEQRLMARLIKSFLNTSYKEGFRDTINDEKWFDEPYIIAFLQNKITSIKDTKLKNFVTDACDLLPGTMQLTDPEFKQEQKDNLEALRIIVDQVFKHKEQQLSNFEETFLDHIMKERNNRINDSIPVDLIFKMQKITRGFGIALTCDFLKESHLCNIAKPDVHLRHVFSIIDGIPYSEDLILVKRISEFAENVGKKPDPDDFCNSGPYYIDKIIWMLCSRNKEYNDNGTQIKIPSFKDELLKRIAAKLQEID